LPPSMSCVRTSISVPERFVLPAKQLRKIKRRCSCHINSNPLIFAK
jgi:hypothetical protein